MVCKLNTRCSIVAACNPQSSFDDAVEGVTANVAMASPLLSRFDLIFMLSDHGRAEEWDSRLADEILEMNEAKAANDDDHEEDFDVSERRGLSSWLIYSLFSYYVCS
jgi:DNA helicase MCM9